MLIRGSREEWGWPVAISNEEILSTIAAYLERYPDEEEQLAEPLRLLSSGMDIDFTSRRNFQLHVTIGALLVRDEAEILLVEHLAYGILLQPGGHLEPTDTTLVDAAVRELTEETGIDASTVTCVSPVPVYIEHGPVPARPQKDEPEHFHFDIGFAFATADGDVGHIQESEVTGAGWYPLGEAEQLVGRRIARAVPMPA